LATLPFQVHSFILTFPVWFFAHDPRGAFFVILLIFILLHEFATPFSSPPTVFVRRGRCFDAIFGSNMAHKHLGHVGIAPEGVGGTTDFSDGTDENRIKEPAVLVFGIRESTASGKTACVPDVRDS
jgi:hypothetical protein